MLTKLSVHGRSHTPDLVDLLGECHDKIRRFVALAHTAAVRADAPADQVAKACVDATRYFREALPLHVADEEESILPRLRGLSSDIDRALDHMAQQHQQHALKLWVLLAALAEVQTAPHKADSRRALARAAVRMKAEFDEHLALEESIIFPAIRHHLSRDTQATVIDELRRRRQGDARHVTPAIR